MVEPSSQIYTSFNDVYVNLMPNKEITEICKITLVTLIIIASIGMLIQREYRIKAEMQKANEQKVKFAVDNLKKNNKEIGIRQLCIALMKDESLDPQAKLNYMISNHPDWVRNFDPERYNK